MTRRNVPLTVIGRQRVVTQVIEHARPIAHVAAEFHILRSILNTWLARYRTHRKTGLTDSSSPPPGTTPRACQPESRY